MKYPFAIVILAVSSACAQEIPVANGVTIAIEPSQETSFATMSAPSLVRAAVPDGNFPDVAKYTTRVLDLHSVIASGRATLASKEAAFTDEVKTPVDDIRRSADQVEKEFTLPSAAFTYVFADLRKIVEYPNYKPGRISPETIIGYSVFYTLTCNGIHVRDHDLAMTFNNRGLDSVSVLKRVMDPDQGHVPRVQTFAESVTDEADRIRLAAPPAASEVYDVSDAKVFYCDFAIIEKGIASDSLELSYSCILTSRSTVAADKRPTSWTLVIAAAKMADKPRGVVLKQNMIKGKSKM